MLVLVVSADQAANDHEAVARVCHDFDATTVADLEVAIDHAAKSAQRQLRNARAIFIAGREVERRRSEIKPVAG